MKLLAIAVLFLCTTWAAAQQYSIPGRFDLFTTDELGNVYAVTGDVIALHAPDGRQLARNSFNAFGPITRIDAFSSLKPLIFSQRQGTLALLDNTLSIQGSSIPLSRSGYPQVVQVCTSVRNSFWFFDERELALLRVDDQLRPLANSGRLDQLLGYTPEPTYMTELDGWLYVCDPEHGVHVFDLFGTYARTLPIPDVQRIEVRDGGIIHLRNGELQRYDLRHMGTETIPWPATIDPTAVRAVRVERGMLYLLLDASIEIVAP